MGLTMKKPLCCCSSLRSASIILLFFNLVLNAYASLTALLAITNKSPVYLRIIGIQAEYVLVFNLFFAMLSFFIFLFAVISIYKESPSSLLLTASVWVLLLSVAYSMYVLMVLTIARDIEKKFNAAIEDSSGELDPDERFRLRLGMGWMFGPLLLIMIVAAIVGSGFQLYSAMIIYSYNEELKHRPIYTIPPSQNNPYDKGINASASAPYAPNAQFVDNQYPPHSNQYPVVAPSYPSQPSQYPVATQNYPQASP